MGIKTLKIPKEELALRRAGGPIPNWPVFNLEEKAKRKFGGFPSG